jgi:alpha-amylase
LLLKHAELSDDVAFRFSDRNWPAYPLSAEQYLDWFRQYPADHCVNLFMDFETFGEHQWADTGVFDFFASFVAQFLHNQQNHFVVPREMWRVVRAKEVPQKRPSLFGRMKALALGTWQLVAQRPAPDTKPARYDALPIYDVPYPISWADVNRDLTAWIDNSMQQDTLQKMYALEEVLLARADVQLLDTWRRLQTSDHFYYMCTKWSADGDVHAYFSPYDSPYEAYRRFCIVLADLEGRVG